MSLPAILQWIGLAVVVLSLTLPILWAFTRMGEGEDDEEAARSGCGCLLLIWQLGIAAVVIACVVELAQKYLL